MNVKLTDKSARGVFRFSWRSPLDGAQCEVQWDDDLDVPLAFVDGFSVQVTTAERFGFRKPVTAENFREFAQRFADASQEATS